MRIGLTKRLKSIVDMCEFCDTIIDVGADHGKVPIALANIGLANNVIAIDNKKGPLKRCEENAKLYLTNKNVNFTTMLSDGLSNVDKDTECAIIIAGMGYDNMCEILSDIDERNYKYLVLSPHSKIDDFIEFLNSKNIKIVDKVELIDHKKKYFIFKAKKYY